MIRIKESVAFLIFALALQGAGGSSPCGGGGAKDVDSLSLREGGSCGDSGPEGSGSSARDTDTASEGNEGSERGYFAGDEASVGKSARRVCALGNPPRGRVWLAFDPCFDSMFYSLPKLGGFPYIRKGSQGDIVEVPFSYKLFEAVRSMCKGKKPTDPEIQPHTLDELLRAAHKLELGGSGAEIYGKYLSPFSTPIVEHLRNFFKVLTRMDFPLEEWEEKIKGCDEPYRRIILDEKLRKWGYTLQDTGTGLVLDKARLGEDFPFLVKAAAQDVQVAEGVDIEAPRLRLISALLQ